MSVRPRARLTGIALGAGVVAAASAASAQGFALSRFEPAERGSRFFVADSLELRDARTQLTAGVSTSYAHRTRLFGTRAEGEASRLAETAIFVHPGASAVVAPGARFAFDLPVALHQAGRAETIVGVPRLPPGSPRLGDLRIAFALRLLGQGDRDENGFALLGGVVGWLPTGSQVDLTSDGFARFGGHVAAVYRYEFILATSRVEYMYRPTALYDGALVGSEVHLKSALAFTNRDWTVGPELFGATAIDAAFAKRATPLELLLGLHRVLGDVRVGAAIGSSVASGVGAPYMRAVFSIEWAPSPRASDRDKDGVDDERDACPDVAGPSSSDARVTGCPPPPPPPDPEPAAADEPGGPPIH